MNFLSLFKKEYLPLNIVEVSSDALFSNYSYLSSLNTNIAVVPVIKSNGYGHGLVNVAKILDRVDAPFICVDSIYEGYELLKNHVKTPILIMGYINPENLKVKRLPFSHAVYNREQVFGISRYQPHAGIHVFVDTGMHREGVSIDDLPAFLQYVNELGLHVEGLMSHLAAADKPESELTKRQVSAFEKAQGIVKEAGLFPKWIHLGASSALINHSKYAGKLGNMARAGISLYGIDPEGKDKQLHPALSLVSTLSQVKKLQKGEKVGYDFTFTAPKDMTVGILPIGYYDGVDRRLSNKGYVSINNTECPIIGRVSMNLTTVDISAVKDPQIGERVVVYSTKPSEKNSISNAAAMSETIPYELLVGLVSSTKRVVR
jgi:alanine racemase